METQQIPKENGLFIRKFGRAVRITAMAVSDEAANRYLEEHPDEGVIDSCGPFVLIAKITDRGEPIE